MAKQNSVKTLNQRFPMYRCVECGKQTRIGSEDDLDAQMRQLCVPCDAIGALEFEHELWLQGETEHGDKESCPICNLCNVYEGLDSGKGYQNMKVITM